MDYERAPLRRVSRKRPCPICNHDDWCSVSTDAAVAICMRRDEGSIKRTANDGYLHILIDRRPSPPQRQSAPPPPVTTTPRASADHLNRVYSRLLSDYLRLSEMHRRSLLRRGLADGEIERNSYRSAPGRAAGNDIAAALARELPLAGVPGFYKECGRWRMIHLGEGFYIPVRDSAGLIRGLQIRRDTREPRYKWFSTNPERFPSGTKSGTPLHFAGFGLLPGAREVILTEGALKADVTTYFLHAPVIAAAGVTSFGPRFAARLRERFPRLELVYLGFDMDWQQKEPVRASLFRRMDELEQAGFCVRVRTWPAHLGKGIDDYLLAITEGREAA